MNPIKQLSTGFRSDAAEVTEHLAESFAAELPENTVLALHGDLGSGKTTFVRGLARHWGITEPVTSPTFNLYTIYQGSRQLIHLDAYRLSTASDLDPLMIEDFMQPPWCFAVEWPERIISALPGDTWHLHFSIDPKKQHLLRLDGPA